MLEPGTTIDGKFVIKSFLGRGGFGYAYRATQLGFDRDVVVKLNDSPDDAEANQRFLREAYALSAISNPYVVRFYGFGAWKNQTYIAMEFAKGDSLENLIQREPSITLIKKIRIAQQVAEGLACLHANGIAHRDLTPRNILVHDIESDRPTCKIIDFGLVKLISEEHQQMGAQKLTEAGLAVGTALYMSPEQCVGSTVKMSCDIYAFACMLFFLIARRPPYHGESAVSLMLQHTAAPFPSLPAASNPKEQPFIDQLSKLIEACSSKDPEDRLRVDEAIVRLAQIEQTLVQKGISDIELLKETEQELSGAMNIPDLEAPKRKPIRLVVALSVASVCLLAAILLPWPSLMAMTIAPLQESDPVTTQVAMLILNYAPNSAGSSELSLRLVNQLARSGEQRAQLLYDTADACIELAKIRKQDNLAKSLYYRALYGLDRDAAVSREESVRHAANDLLQRFRKKHEEYVH